MNLNHLHLSVSDVVATRQFLEKYLGMRGFDEKYNKGMDFVTDENGMVLTLMKASKNEELHYPGHFHIGFIQPNEESVNEINRQLKKDGYDVPEPSRQHGSWTFYMTCPGGFTVEILA